MKILAIGDPHGDLEKIKKIPMKNIDLILLTGDLGKIDFARKKAFENSKRKKEGLSELRYTSKDKREEYMEIYNSILNILNCFPKDIQIYSILGNNAMIMIHDFNVKKDEEKYKIKLPYLRKEINKINNFHLVRNSFRNINGLRIGFLEYFIDNSWIKEFDEKDNREIKSSKKETEKAKRVLNNFKSLDILVCHQPPYGYLDKVNFSGVPEKWKGKHAGSKVILDYIKKYQPKYVLCGHIHEGEGKVKIGKTEVYNLGVAGHKIINL